MTTSLEPPAPRLGDPLATFIQLLGEPTLVRQSRFGTVRRFVQGGQRVTVLLDGDRAIALHATFADDDLTPFQLQYRWYRARGDRDYRFYVGEDGWALVSRRCPLEALRLLGRGWRV